MKHLFLLAFLLLGSSLSFAQTFTGVTRVNPDASGSAERSPIIQLGRDGGIYVGWIKGTEGDIYLTRSTDGGMTFMAPTKVTTGGKIASSMQRTLQFVLDTKDRIHLVWLEGRVNTQTDVWYVRSTDKGMTWTTPVTVVDANDSSKYWQDFPSIAVDSSDNLYVSFIDPREEVRGTSPNFHLYLTKSTDGGNTWSANKKTEVMPGGIGGTCECCGQDIAVSPEGHVYMAFRSNITNRRDIWVTRSMDGGNTFEEAILIQSGRWNLAACPMSGPNITLDGKEDLHVAWMDDRDDSSSGNAGAYYARLPKNSRTATPNQKLSRSSEFPRYPDVATTKDGSRVEAVYNVELKQIQFNSSISDEGVAPGSTISPSTKSQEYGRITIGPDGTTYTVWQDARRDNADIYFAKYKPSSSVKNVGENDEDAVRVFPNPATAGKINLSLEMKESIQPKLLTITNILGEVVFTKTFVSTQWQRTLPLELPEYLQSGKYYCTISSDERSYRVSFIIE